MKHIGQTFSYLKNSFWLPVVAMLVPSIVACFLSTPYWEVAFVAGFNYVPYKSAGQTFTILFGDSWQFLWPVVIIAVFQVLGAAFIMSAVDRHLRTDKLSFKAPLRMINNSVFPITICVAVMSVASVILRFLLFGLVLLVQVVAGAIGFSPGAALAIISAVAVGLFVFHVFLIMPMLYWAPIMFIYGYKFRDAAATSFKLLSGKRIFMGLLLPMLLCAGLQLLIGFLQIHIAAQYAVNFVIFLFTNVYVTVYTMITFYSICDLDRRDIKPYHNPVLPRVRENSADTAPDKPAKKSGAKKQSAKHTKENGDVV